MIAGRDTTGCTLTNLFRLLGENPDEEKQLIAELLPLQPNFDDLIRAPFADACFNEAVRLFAPVGTDLRVAVRDLTLPSGIRARKNDAILIPLYSIGRNPKEWDNPEAFFPRRWLEMSPPSFSSNGDGTQSGIYNLG